jgi:protoheme IX farnesyltransferase
MTKADSNNPTPHIYKEYYRLTKPGIVYGNIFTTLAAFLFASRWHVASVLFFATLLGLALVIASACVFNNYIDQDIDPKMVRTKSRALAAGIISNQSALVYATVLGLVGIALLFFYVNSLTALVALGGFVVYVFVYTFAKRYSAHAPLWGSVSGAVPILAGYTAVINRIDTTALLLFMILVVWQIPHFDAIAISRLDEYKAANIPILPLRIGVQKTKYHILVYILIFIFATSSLWLLGFVGTIYFTVTLLVNFMWLALAIKGFWAKDNKKWARKLFLFSLIVLVVFSVLLAASPFLP